MKVLFILPKVPAGGVERVRLILIEWLMANGIECRLALRHYRGELMEQARTLVPVLEFAPRGVHQFIPALTRLIAREQPTHVVTAFSDVGFMAWIALRRSGHHAAWIHSVHSSHYKVRPGLVGKIRSSIENCVAGHVYKCADTVVAVSEGVREEIIEKYRARPSRIKTIYNPVVPDVELRPLRKLPTENIRLFRIVALGRLMRVKGFDVLIRAMARVSGSWRLNIWGEGPERKNLESLIQQLGLQDKVHLRGYTSAPYEAMREADLYVLSSRHEGLPASLIEALACQCQIVATDCPVGPSEILQRGEFGQLVPVEEPEALAAAVRRVMVGGFRVCPARLLARARDFSQPRGCAQWEELLRAVEYE